MQELNVDKEQQELEQVQKIAKLMEEEPEELVQEKPNEENCSYGKFKDATALLNAYNQLQSEFTKRCQRIKELEAKVKDADKETTPAQSETDKKGESFEGKEDKDNILKKYLVEILAKKQSAIVLDGVGVGVKTPIERPKTLAQAGMLAKEIFNK